MYVLIGHHHAAVTLGSTDFATGGLRSPLRPGFGSLATCSFLATAVMATGLMTVALAALQGKRG
jgi:hypothetical protein